MVRVCLALLLASTALCATAATGTATAATVRTETIRIDPPQPVTPQGTNPSAEPSVTPGAGQQIPAGQVPSILTDQPEDTAPSVDDVDALDEPPSQQNQLPVPEVRYGADGLPTPVARMREQLMEAARSGDVEKMRMVLEGNEMMPTLSLTEIGDPIAFLKDSSGDGNGMEILAILLDVLEAGWVKVDAGTAQEMYVWPYFARYPFDKLTPQQKVEMYRIVTAGDFAEMDAYGAWLFYRVGIGPDGTLHYFVAGE
ncbi:hypothetical protein [Pannonibacter carbonis]|uniref:hypothetical protein n=1 Tax=Pannonibacter carbonis TaxID=2067569 RepID=UPI001AD90B33|nr:hypothetical protein [Pannonibacter carbonis]